MRDDRIWPTQKRVSGGKALEAPESAIRRVTMAGANTSVASVNNRARSAETAAVTGAHRRGSQAGR